MEDILMTLKKKKATIIKNNYEQKPFILKRKYLLLSYPKFLFIEDKQITTHAKGSLKIK